MAPDPGRRTRADLLDIIAYSPQDGNLLQAAKNNGNKYTIYGRDTYGNPFYVCGKIILGNDSQRRYFLITAHERS
jgi:hypothetical protein